MPSAAIMPRWFLKKSCNRRDIVIGNVEKEIISIVADVSETDEGEINLDTNLVQNLGINSIKAIEIGVEIKKK